jgi:hypothetical protein
MMNGIKRTEVKLVRLGGSDLDINKVDLELLVGLHTDEERRSSSGKDDLVGEVLGLEDEGERSLLLNKGTYRRGR